MPPDEQHKQLVSALKEALRDDSEMSPLLIKRVPFICVDIKNIKDDIGWIKKVVFGAGSTIIIAFFYVIIAKIFNVAL